MIMFGLNGGRICLGCLDFCVMSCPYVSADSCEQLIFLPCAFLDSTWSTSTTHGQVLREACSLRIMLHVMQSVSAKAWDPWKFMDWWLKAESNLRRFDLRQS